MEWDQVRNSPGLMASSPPWEFQQRRHYTVTLCVCVWLDCAGVASKVAWMAAREGGDEQAGVNVKATETRRKCKVSEAINHNIKMNKLRTVGTWWLSECPVKHGCMLHLLVSGCIVAMSHQNSPSSSDSCTATDFHIPCAIWSACAHVTQAMSAWKHLALTDWWE